MADWRVYSDSEYQNPRTFEKMPCGAPDQTRGNLWAAVRHARTCKEPECAAFLTWFEGFRRYWRGIFPPHTQQIYNVGRT